MTEQEDKKISDFSINCGVLNGLNPPPPYMGGVKVTTTMGYIIIHTNKKTLIIPCEVFKSKKRIYFTIPEISLDNFMNSEICGGIKGILFCKLQNVKNNKTKKRKKK